MVNDKSKKNNQESKRSSKNDTSGGRSVLDKLMREQEVVKDRSNSCKGGS